MEATCRLTVGAREAKVPIVFHQDLPLYLLFSLYTELRTRTLTERIVCMEYAVEERRGAECLGLSSPRFTHISQSNTPQ